MENTLRIEHVVDLPLLDSQIAAARDYRNRIHLFLIINHNGPVYKRNGLADTWEEMDLQDQMDVRSLGGFDSALHFNSSTSTDIPACHAAGDNSPSFN